jgi:hypothetical protein
MVTLMVGQVDLEQVEVLVDVSHQTQPLHHQMQRTDTTAADALHAGSYLIVDVTGLEHGARLVLPVLWAQSAFDSALATSENLRVASVHSK